jgi:prefoldin subunit 5
MDNKTVIVPYEEFVQLKEAYDSLQKNKIYVTFDYNFGTCVYGYKTESEAVEYLKEKNNALVKHCESLEERVSASVAKIMDLEFKLKKYKNSFWSRFIK